VSKGNELLRKAAATQLGRLYRAKVMRHLLSVVVGHLHSVGQHTRVRGDALDTSECILRDRLNAEIADASSSALLLGALTQDKKLQAEALRLTHGWLLGHSAGVMQFLEPTGQTPGRYLSETHDELKHALQSELAGVVSFEEYPLPTDVPTLQGMVRERDSRLSELAGALYDLRYPKREPT